MKKITVLASSVLLTACTSMTDMMDGASGLGALSIDQDSFDGTTIISLTPDTLYDPEASVFNPVDSRIGAVWSSESPDFVHLAFQQDGGYVNFTEISFNIDNSIKTYTIGLSDLKFSSTHLGGMKSTAYSIISTSVFKEILSADTCRMRIKKDTGNEQADCKLDRIPGGKKTAILGFRKMLTAIEENTK